MWMPDMRRDGLPLLGMAWHYPHARIAVMLGHARQPTAFTSILPTQRPHQPPRLRPGLIQLFFRI